jgi:hypothetical protein
LTIWFENDIFYLWWIFAAKHIFYSLISSNEVERLKQQIALVISSI